MKRQKLGQHYLVDERTVGMIVGFADVQPSERVLEIGTGRGALTKQLANRGTSLLGYEVDEENYETTLEAVRGTKARIELADPFMLDPKFDVLVTSLPYSESAKFIKWLSARRFDRAVAVLQEDFVKKVTARPGDRDYRGISAVAQIALQVRVLAKVERAAFYPPPRVASVVASFTPKRKLSEEEVAAVIRLFSIRRREVDSALAKLGIGRSRSFGKRRVFSLTPEEVYEICSRLSTVRL